MAHLDEIIAANERLVRSQPAAPKMPWTARRELCIVTCVDPRLVRFFPTTLGLDRGDAVVIRIPGANVLVGHGDGLRSVAAAVYINKATEFIVLGHTDCGTTKVDVGALTSEMQQRGVAPDSMPGGPREFLGAVSDLRAAVKASATAIRAAPFLPRDLLVHAAILDIESGALEIVERGENFQDQASAASVASGSVGYVPGRATALNTGLGDGMRLLQASTVSSLWDGAAALQASNDPFAALSSKPPPGWSDGGSALAPSAMSSTSAPGALDFTSTMAAPTAMAAATTMLSVTPLQMPSVPAVQAPQTVSFEQQPVQTQVQMPAAPPLKKAQPRRVQPARRKLAPEFQQSVDKVREFYRLNFTLEQRKQIARALANAARNNRGSAELAKTVIKPILDLGQKRYKVIDEVIAIKEQATGMAPDDALELLSRLFE